MQAVRKIDVFWRKEIAWCVTLKHRQGRREQSACYRKPRKLWTQALCGESLMATATHLRRYTINTPGRCTRSRCGFSTIKKKLKMYSRKSSCKSGRKPASSTTGSANRYVVHD